RCAGRLPHIPSEGFRSPEALYLVPAHESCLCSCPTSCLLRTLGCWVLIGKCQFDCLDPAPLRPRKSEEPSSRAAPCFQARLELKSSHCIRRSRSCCQSLTFVGDRICCGRFPNPVCSKYCFAQQY